MSSIDLLYNAAEVLESSSDVEAFRIILSSVYCQDPGTQQLAMSLLKTHFHTFPETASETALCLCYLLDHKSRATSSDASDLLQNYSKPPLIHGLADLVHFLLVDASTRSLSLYETLFQNASDDAILVLLSPLCNVPLSCSHQIEQNELIRSRCISSLINLKDKNLLVTQTSGPKRQYKIIKGLMIAVSSFPATEAELHSFLEIILSMPSMVNLGSGVGFIKNRDVPGEKTTALNDIIEFLDCIIQPFINSNVNILVENFTSNKQLVRHVASTFSSILSLYIGFCSQGATSPIAIAFISTHVLPFIEPSREHFDLLVTVASLVQELPSSSNPHLLPLIPLSFHMLKRFAERFVVEPVTVHLSSLLVGLHLTNFLCSRFPLSEIISTPGFDKISTSSNPSEVYSRGVCDLLSTLQHLWEFAEQQHVKYNPRTDSPSTVPELMSTVKEVVGRIKYLLDLMSAVPPRFVSGPTISQPISWLNKGQFTLRNVQPSVQVAEKLNQKPKESGKRRAKNGGHYKKICV
ncbi:hypothetical protein RCL1_005970 [Eukaryota sp. TZLM3-RCL]